MRQLLILFLGLAVGVAGAILVRGSLPPAADSPEARILALENELRETRLRLAKIDPAQARPREDAGHALSAGARAALEDLKAGRPVDMNNLYQAMKPLMRDLAPIFDNIRRRDERRAFERISGEMSRKYGLNAAQQEALKQWMKERSASNAAAFNALAWADSTRLDDLVRASRNVRPDDGLDAFMETQLAGTNLDAFRQDRLAERAQRVQNEADWKVQRLTNTVGLDDAQQDQVFSIMARSSRDFDPKMQIQGVATEATPTVGADRDTAIQAVLRPDQQTRYLQWRAERQARAAQEMAEMGLKMPPGWDALSED